MNPVGNGNGNLKHAQRSIKFEVYDDQGKVVLTKEGGVNFNAQAGNFTGTLALDSLPGNSYTLRVKTNQHLRVKVPGIYTLEGTTTQLPPVYLVSGDINNDNTLNILDYNILIGCYEEVGPAVNCIPNNKVLSDLTDDGTVNGFDYNLFLREISTRRGEEDGPAISPTKTPTPTATRTPTPTKTPTPTATRTPTPAPVTTTGWPNATNTGYKNAPGYTGGLTTFSGSIQSGQTYRFMYFPNGVSISKGVTNVTFFGCRFTSNAVDNANVTTAGDNITFDYSTFEPKVAAGASPSTVAYNAGYQYAINQTAPGKITADHSDFWGWGNGIQFYWSSKDKPLTVRNSWFHHARDDGNDIDHTDAILANDGINISYVVIDHNTIVSVGNTNGLALQYDGHNYDHITVTNNYFSGFAYTVNVGGDGHITNLTFTGNTFGTDIKPGYGPLYGWRGGGSGNTWRNNKWRVAPGTTWSTASNDGKYWTPNGVSSTDYTGN